MNYPVIMLTVLPVLGKKDKLPEIFTDGIKTLFSEYNRE